MKKCLIAFCLLIFSIPAFSFAEELSTLGFTVEEHPLKWHMSSAIPLKKGESKDEYSFGECGRSGGSEPLGLINGKEYYSSIYWSNRGTCAVVFWQMSSKKNLVPVSAWSLPTYEDGVVDPPKKPKVLKVGKETLILIEREVPGTGNFNADQYFLVSEKQVLWLSDANWLEPLKALLPKGYGIWKGIRLDFSKPMMKVPVWKAGDGNASPTGGEIQFSIDIVKNQFHLKHAEFIKSKESDRAGSDADFILIPWGWSGWNSFQILGMNSKGVAVREIRSEDLPDDQNEGKICNYPGLSALLKGRSRLENSGAVMAEGFGSGVRLHTWKLPQPGSGGLVDSENSTTFVVYQEGLKEEGCTSKEVSAEALEKAKTEWKNLAIAWEQKVQSLEIYPHGPVKVKGSCFKTKRNSPGCDFKSKHKFLGRDLVLKYNLLAESDCVTKSDDEFEHGCQADRRYKGKISLGKREASFNISVPGSKGGNPQNELTHVAIYSQNGISIAVLYFSWAFVTERSKAVALLRLE